MVTQGPVTPETPVNQASPLLEEFLITTGDLIPRVAEVMRGQTREPSDHVLITALAGPLTIQVTRLAEYLRSLAADAPAPVIAQVNAVLERTAAIPVSQSARLVAENLSSVTTKIAFGDLFELIKKIILELLEKVFDIDVADWVISLFDIIDELVNFLLSLGLFRVSHMMSRRQQDAMETLTKMARLETAFAARRRAESGI
jgi:hypothetical protein